MVAFPCTSLGSSELPALLCQFTTLLFKIPGYKVRFTLKTDTGSLETLISGDLSENPEHEEDDESTGERGLAKGLFCGTDEQQSLWLWDTAIYVWTSAAPWVLDAGDLSGAS